MIEKIKNRYAENKMDFLKWIIAFVPIVFMLIIFSRIPEQIPVQYNEAGKVIKYASKYSFDMLLQASLGLLAAIIMSALLKFILGINFRPEQKHYEKVVSVMKFINLVMTAIFSLFSIMILVKYI